MSLPTKSSTLDLLRSAGYDPKRVRVFESSEGHLRQMTRAWEIATGCDSIATIERIYDTTPAGSYLCIWPRCRFARRDPAALWRHVHSAHGVDHLPPEHFDPEPYAAEIDES